MDSNRKIYLGVDFGTKRVGLAISSGIVAGALKSIMFNNNIEEFIGEISKIIEEQKVNHVVIGLPLRRGEETAQSRIHRSIGEAVKSKLKVEVSFADEAYSTQEARRMNDKNVDIDSESARIILEQFLNES